MSDEFEVRVKPVEVREGRIRTAANVGVLRRSIREIWFELDETHRGALVDRADPFVVAALVLAMSSERTMMVRGAPVSASLLRNLEEFQLVWHAWYGFPVVDIVAEEEVDPVDREPAAITAFTGGVDSAFSAYRHTRWAHVAVGRSPGRDDDPRCRRAAHRRRRVSAARRRARSGCSTASGSSS